MAPQREYQCHGPRKEQAFCTGETGGGRGQDMGGEVRDVSQASSNEAVGWGLLWLWDRGDGTTDTLSAKSA